MKMLVTLFVFFALASSALGFCPFTPFIAEADIGAIAGRWYGTPEPFLDYLPNSTAITMDFTPRPDGNFNLTISGTNPDGSKKSGCWLAKRTRYPQQLHIYEFPDSQNLLKFYFDTPEKTPFKVNFNVMVTDNYVDFLNGHFCFIFTTRSFPTYGGNFSRTDTMNADKNVELTDLFG